MASAATPDQAAQAAANAVSNFLRIAPKKYRTIQGSVAGGLAGGASSTVVWNQQIPIIPAFITAIDYTINLPITLTLGPTTGSATASPLAPYSIFANQLNIGGAPPWPLTELTPWYLDGNLDHIEFDPSYNGFGQNQGFFANILDQGPNPNSFPAAIQPNATVTNVTGSPTNTNYTYAWWMRQQLQRRRHVLWGSVPAGDPENRPENIMQMNPLVGGSNPEQNMFVNTAGAGTTAVTNGAATINATYELAYIDLLYPGMQASPQPTVGFGLQLIAFNTTGLNAGNITPVTHRTAMIYNRIHHLLVNGGLPIRADYFGLWDDQDQQAARWQYDAQVNTFFEYFHKVQKTYRRFFNTGHYFVDMYSGEFPEIASVTPLDALMSPDAQYAALAGVPVTPAMTTALRIPTGTSLVNPTYLRTYSIGLVGVTY